MRWYGIPPVPSSARVKNSDIRERGTSERQSIDGTHQVGRLVVWKEHESTRRMTMKPIHHLLLSCRLAYVLMRWRPALLKVFKAFQYCGLPMGWSVSVVFVVQIVGRVWSYPHTASHRDNITSSNIHFLRIRYSIWMYYYSYSSHNTIIYSIVLLRIIQQSSFY